MLHSVQAKTAVMTTAPPNNAKKPGVSPLNIKTQRGLSKGSIPLIREQARAEQWLASMPYSIYGMPSWNMPSIRMIDTVVGLVGVGEKKTKGMPIIAVKRCPNSIPLDLDRSSARPVVTNMDAKNTPANKARRLPSMLPPEISSTKNKIIPSEVAATAIMSPLRNFCLKIRDDRMMMKIGAEY